MDDAELCERAGWLFGLNRPEKCWSCKNILSASSKCSRFCDNCVNGLVFGNESTATTKELQSTKSSEGLLLSEDDLLENYNAETKLALPMCLTACTFTIYACSAWTFSLVRLLYYDVVNSALRYAARTNTTVAIVLGDPIMTEAITQEMPMTWRTICLALFDALIFIFVMLLWVLYAVHYRPLLTLYHYTCLDLYESSWLCLLSTNKSQTACSLIPLLFGIWSANKFCDSIATLAIRWLTTEIVVITILLHTTLYLLTRNVRACLVYLYSDRLIESHEVHGTGTVVTPCQELNNQEELLQADVEV